MVSGYVLILAVLILGGFIATLGDRVGTRVGKARLSLFNLRPRQTATLVSIATGSVISASTLALLFGVSSQLRTGVFELSKIQADLASAEADLAQAQSTQESVEADLESATDERQRALARLQEINQSLNQAVAQQEATEGQLRQTLGQLDAVSQQAAALRQSTDALRVQRDNLLAQQATIGKQIADRDRAIAQREQRLTSLEAEQDFLEQQVAVLQTQYQGLFRGNIALNRNQEILVGQGRAENREQAEEFVTGFLLEANRLVSRAIAPGALIDQQILLIGNREVEALIDRLSTGEDYVVRLLSAANYITGEPCVVQQGEPCVQVFIDATPNQQVYALGERLATVTLDPPPLGDRQLVERLNLLLAAAQFRARQDGVVSDTLQVADNRPETVLNFLETVQQSGRAVELQAIAATNIFTAGPVQIHLAAVRDGRILFQTNESNNPLNNSSNLRSE
jgi:uncharacterized protein (DUF3084 family)